MSDAIRCKCRRCVCRGLMWPAVLITIGALFLLGRVRPDLGIVELWPVILIVIGAVLLAGSLASSEGHISS